jgi:MYXO-CTERM domain-containing protein
MKRLDRHAGRSRLALSGALLAAITTTATVTATWVGQASAAPVACRAAPGGPVAGPCKSPDPVAYFPANGAIPATIVANFGLLVPGKTAGSWQYVCDDVFGQPEATRERRSPNGEIFLPTTRGLLITSDQCKFTQAGGDIAGKIIYDVAIDEKNPALVFAIGDTPRVLWRSTDGGKTFTTIQTFPAGLALLNVVLPPKRSKEVYVIGRGKGTSTPVGFSNDDGATFTMRDPGLAAGAAIATSFDFQGADPISPATLYFTLLDSDGDRLWRSTDGGATATQLLKLGSTEALAGLAFGPTPGTIYVAGADLFPLVGSPPGTLYLSRDDGKTWQPPRPSPQTGPQFKCLVAAGPRLYACSTGQGRKEDLMLAYSDNEGQSWTTVTTLGDLAGPTTCAADACLNVSRWLCDTYTSCAEGLSPTPQPEPSSPIDAGAAPDAGMVPAPTLPHEDSGCAFATAPSSAPATALALLALLVRHRRR